VTAVPTDHASGSIVVDADPADVLAVLRDVEAQPEWVPQVTAAELLEEYEDGTPATAAFELSTPMGNDAFTLEFEHDGEGLSWTLVSSQMQKSQDGSYRLRPSGAGGTEVTLDLTIEHSLSVPGFLRRKVFGGWVDGSLKGLKEYVENGA
jgi:ribosome-associated toxin RatA of RatAB toxin-antitoxin module